MERMIMATGLGVFGMMVTNYFGVTFIVAVIVFVVIAGVHTWREEKRLRARKELIERIYAAPFKADFEGPYGEGEEGCEESR